VLNRRPILALATLLAGIPERYGFGAPPQRMFLNRGAWLYDGRDVIGGGPVPHCRLFLARNGIVVDSVVPQIEADPAARDQVRARFADAPRPWIALAVTVNDEPRRWPGNRFADLAMRLRALTGGTVFLHGGPHHAAQADEVVQALPPGAPHILNLSRQSLEFVEVMALLAESDLFVGNESGPLNVSAALGAPSYGLFGNAAPHKSLSPRIRPILPATGEPDLATGMQRLTVDHVMAQIAPALEAIAPRQANGGG
jgi:heptosyltransferase-2